MAWGDMDKDGRLDFITGQSRGLISWYRQEAVDRWVRHKLGENSPPDVGGKALDVDGGGDLDIVSRLWRLRKDNANQGRNHVDLLENLSPVTTGQTSERRR